MNSSYNQGIALFEQTGETSIQDTIQALQDIAPHISRYIVECFGQLFSNPVLTYPQREMVVISSLISLGDTPNQLKWHMNFGIKVGIIPNEILEIATHNVPFCGFPRVLNAIGVAKALFAEKNIHATLTDDLLLQVNERRERGLNKLREIDGEHGEKVLESLSSLLPSLSEQIVKLAFGEIYSRPGLTLKQRQLITLAALTAQGGCERQLRVHLHASLRVGLTKPEILEALLHCYPYTGFPKVLNAVAVAQEVFG